MSLIALKIAITNIFFFGGGEVDLSYSINPMLHCLCCVLDGAKSHQLNSQHSTSITFTQHVCHCH